MIFKPLLPIFLLLFLTACATASTPSSQPLTATPSFDSSKYGTAELDVTYCVLEEPAVDPADQPIQKMDVYYPASGGPWPAFLYVHGGSWIEGDKAEGEGWRGLNERGYLVVSINYRMAPINKFPLMINDLKCAVRYLRAHADDYNLDPNHIAALGASAGGHLVALMGTSDESAGWDIGEYLNQSSRVKAVVSMSGFSDFTRKIPGGVGTPIYSAFGAVPGTNSPKLVVASPVTYITADDPPFLILHGDRDNIAPPEQSTILDEKLTAAGVPSTLVIVKGGDHGLQGPDASPTPAEVYQMILDFLETNLK
jgi:acetyl esterase/lipase